MANSVETSRSSLALRAESVGLLAVALFFTGWMYRWHYYTFFQVEPTSLGLSVESTFIAAYAVLFAGPWAAPRDLPAPAARQHGDLRQWLAAQRREPPSTERQPDLETHFNPCPRIWGRPAPPCWGSSAWRP